MGKFFKIIFLLASLLVLNQCGENSSSEISRGHRDAIKYECNSDPDEKLCGKEVRLKFKRDGHEYITFENLSKEQTNRVQTNCIIDKKYGLVAYNQCLYKNRQLAFGHDLTSDDDEVIIASTTDKVKQYSYYVVAYNEDDLKSGASGTGVAIAKNYIATNCHVVLDWEKSIQKKSDEYYDTIEVENLLDKKMHGKVELLKGQLGSFWDVDICILKTKKDIKFVKKKIKFSSLKQTDAVRALGNPQGIKGHTALGRITALETWNHYMNDKFEYPYQYRIPVNIIHHDAAIGKGSSGGPLFDSGGNLIGFNTYIKDKGTSGGFGMAISADHIKYVLDF